MSSGDQINRVRKYIGQLKDDAKISHALSRLDRIDMTIDLLTETHVGKEVNRLRNHAEYGTKAQKIVDKWRKLAAAPISMPSESMKSLKRSIDESDEISADSRMSFADALKASATAPVVVKKIKTTFAEPPPPESTSSALPASLCGQDGGSVSKPNNESDDMFTILRKGKPMKVYAGRKQTKVVTKVDSLFNLAMTVCMQNVNMFTHGPLNTVYSVVKPVLQRCTPEQLERVEHYNPSWREDTDELWEVICDRHFKKQTPKGRESWKACYDRLIAERETRLAAISNRFRNDQKVEVRAIKQLGDTVIAPRNIQRRQANCGTAVVSNRVPSAIEISKARREIYRTGNKSAVAALPQPVRLGGAPSTCFPSSSSRGSSASNSNNNTARKGALMQKSIQMMKRRFRR